MKYFGYTPIRDPNSQERSYWQVWVYDSRAEGGLRLVEPQHHTKSRALELADLLNHEMREFIALNNGDVSLKEEVPVSPASDPSSTLTFADARPDFLRRFRNFLEVLFKRKNK